MKSSFKVPMLHSPFSPIPLVFLALHRTDRALRLNPEMFSFSSSPDMAARTGNELNGAIKAFGDEA